MENLTPKNQQREITVGDYRILAKFSETPVWALLTAEDASIGDKVFLRLLPPRIGRDKKLQKSLFLLSETSSIFLHPAILSLRKQGVHGKYCYAAYNYFLSEPLNKLITRSAKIPSNKILTVIIQIASALQHAHRYGIMHGCLHPSSVLVDDSYQIKIINFHQEPLLTTLFHSGSQSMLLPFASYLSPEQLIPDRIVDGRSDVYSLGILWYEMLTQKRPFASKNLKTLIKQQCSSTPKSPRTINPEIPASVEKIVMRCLTKDPDERYFNCQELLDDLSEIASDFAVDEFFAEHSGQKKIMSSVKKKSRSTKKPFGHFLVGRKQPLIIGTVLLLALCCLSSFAVAFKLKQDSAPTVTQAKLLTSNVKTNRLVLDSRKDSQLATREEPAKPPIIKSKPNNPVTIQTPPAVEPRIAPSRTKSTAKTGSIKFIVGVGNFSTSAQVYLDNKPAGECNEEGSIILDQITARESHKIRIEKDGFLPYSNTVTVTPNETIEMQADLKPDPTRTCDVLFEKGPRVSTIRIGSQNILQPLPATLSIPVGVHTIDYLDNDKNVLFSSTNLFDHKSGNHIYKAPQIEIAQVAIVISNAVQYGYGYVTVNGNKWICAGTCATPMKTQLPIGTHLICIKRDGFTTTPSDTVLNVEKDMFYKLSFTLVPSKR